MKQQTISIVVSIWLSVLTFIVLQNEIESLVRDNKILDRVIINSDCIDTNQETLIKYFNTIK